VIRSPVLTQAMEQSTATERVDFQALGHLSLGEAQALAGRLEEAHVLAEGDDAPRAVRAGLGMIEALGPLNTRLGQARGVHLAVCLGIHTGQVVVGEIGGGARHERLALGETPNVAARLQGLAAPNALVISAATVPLLGGFFACQALGPHLLK
jgi:class 3 adenylate cyclase